MKGIIEAGRLPSEGKWAPGGGEVVSGGDEGDMVRGRRWVEAGWWLQEGADVEQGGSPARGRGEGMGWGGWLVDRDRRPVSVEARMGMWRGSLWSGSGDGEDGRIFFSSVQMQGR